jgi:hypothetical protein
MTRRAERLISFALLAWSAACGVVYARSVVPQPPTVLALSGCYVREAAPASELARQFPDTLALTAEPDISTKRKPAWRVAVGPSRERADPSVWSWQPIVRYPDSVAVWNNGGTGLELHATITAGRLTGAALAASVAAEGYAAKRQQCLGFRR